MVLAVQPLLFVQHSHQALIYVLEPAFGSVHAVVVGLVCEVQQLLYQKFPVVNGDLNGLPPEVTVSASLYSTSCDNLATILQLRRATCGKVYPFVLSFSCV